MPETPPMAPRLKHNLDLATAYLKANKVYSRYPKVTDQIECVPLDTTKLFPFGYNPSIADFNGKLIMAYRYHADTTLATKLAMCELLDGVPVNNQTIEVDGTSTEDPSLFVWNQELFMSFVTSTWPDQPPKCWVRYGRIDTGKLVDIVRPNYGSNDGTGQEKNWCFWPSLEDKLLCLYCSSPGQRVCTPSAVECPGPKWPYGNIRGGTGPVLYDGKWLRFFHSSLDNEMNPQRRRYYMGALLMDTKPPYQTVAVSKKPILYGSEIDNLSGEQRRSCQQYKPQVIFPSGVVERDGCWWVSCGANDSACVIAKVTPERLNF